MHYPVSQELSLKNVPDLCEQMQRECTYTLDGLIFGGKVCLYPGGGVLISRIISFLEIRRAYIQGGYNQCGQWLITREDFNMEFYVCIADS